MGDFLRILLDSIQYLWPLRLIQQWERGGFYFLGRWQRELGPGCYPIVPFFMEIRCISIVPAIVSTGRQDITLSDGTLLSFTASATVRVADLNLAVNTVDNFTETTQELLGAVLSDKLARIDAERVKPDRRTELLRSLRTAVATEAALFGIEVSNIRFTTFVTNVRTYRLLQDTPNIVSW